MSINKFWSKVKKSNDCWEWTGAYNGKGYGQLSINGVTVFAHRYSWQLHNGPIPEGMQVLHCCDNRRCVRPDHLFLGTHEDNMRDMVEKGRQARPRGVKNPQCKIDESIVRTIVKMRKAGILQREIAECFGISRQLVQDVLRGRRWSHVTGIGA